MRKPPLTRKSARELAILNRIAEELNSSADVRKALERTLELVTSLLGLRTGWVWLLDAETSRFYLAASHNLPPFLQVPVRMTGHRCNCIEEFRGGALTPKNIDVIECSRLQPAVRRKAVDLTHGLRYHASIPLYSGARALGIMNVTGPAWRKLAPNELRVLSTIGYYVGVTVERAQLAAGAAQLAKAQERSRIAREIHDTLAQGLTGITLQLEGALRQLTSDPKKARTRLERALTVARESIDEARRSVLGLRSPLGDKSLIDALQALGRKFTSDTGVRVNVDARGVAGLPANVESELFRITGEALANVRKHAKARQVTIALRAAKKQKRKHQVILQIVDDGKGFVTSAETKGQGLVGMRERAELLAGNLYITSRPSRGTKLTVRIPLLASEIA